MPPIVVFNANTGSDTIASGAPADFGPIYGSNAQVTTGNATINLSIDAPDLTGVPVDGSAVIFVNTGSGRSFMPIVAKDAVAYTVTVQSGREPTTTGTFQWAIGGKRATWNNSKQIFADAIQEWIIETETDQILAVDIVVGGAESGTFTTYTDALTIRGTTNNPRPKIIQTLDKYCIHHNRPFRYEKLQFMNSAATKTNAFALQTAGGGRIYAEDCIFGDPNNVNNLSRGIFHQAGTLPILTIVNCAFINITDKAISGDWENLTVDSCLFQNITNACIEVTDTGNHGWWLTSNIVINAKHFIYVGTRFAYVDGLILNNVIANTTSHGIYGIADGGASAPKQSRLTVKNNIFYQCNGYAINWVLPSGYTTFRIWQSSFIGHNCYWQNASGPVSNFPLAPDDVQLDPQFANPAALDFRIGPNLKAKGWPKYDRAIGAGMSQTFSYVDIGAAQRKETPIRRRYISIGVPDHAY
ncbi:MAG: hypothetical protein KatS3mg038_0851 [Candidatus Kapaibacterium sp.]|nr:MAG: hypothetical protein KatS3mg038_0795 [Candidatus Kapabacteria bacterium]GIV50330.1 MAG: hypothetical protein KatS3mg038_0851 [Candidatus Kapabacteria bacterium]